MNTFWWDLREDREARGVAVTFERRGAPSRRVGARVSAVLDADRIAEAMESMLDLPAEQEGGEDVEIRVVRDGLLLPISSARLASVGAVLFQRVAKILDTPSSVTA